MNWNKLFHNMKDGTVIAAVIYIFAKGIPVIQMVERFEANLLETKQLSGQYKETETRITQLEKFADRYADRHKVVEEKLKSMDEKLDIIIGLRTYRK